jgi:uncharacterized protein
VFPAGHRLRLSLAGSDWPNIVPPPCPVTLSIERAGSALTCRCWTGRARRRSLAPPAPSQRHPDPDAGPRSTGGLGLSPPDPRLGGGRAMSPPDPPTRWRVVREVLGRRTEAEIDHGGRSQLPGGATLVERYRGMVGGRAGPSGGDLARGSASYRIEWPEATVATSIRLDWRGDAEAFEVRLDLEAGEGEPRWARTWRRGIPRRLD